MLFFYLFLADGADYADFKCRDQPDLLHLREITKYNLES